MAVDRKIIINKLAVFTDPALLKTKYGFTATPNQIDNAKRVLRAYQTMPDAELKKVSEDTANKWPFVLTEEQRYDKLLHKTTMSIAQQIIWQNIKQYLSQHSDERKTDRDCILKSMADMEGFLSLNTYLGNFEENQRIIDGKDMEYTMKLFNLSYSKYYAEKQRTEKYGPKG